MQIIPVIDLKGGQVVHARMGDRDRYAPLRSRLCDGCDPLAVVAGLMAVYPFEALYVADLDAIAGRQGHDSTLGDIAERFPSLRLWVDSGIATADGGVAWLAQGLGDLVLGTESLADPEVLMSLAATEPARIVLSLDFRGDLFQGPADILGRPALWPQRVIAMTLGRVGSGAGPDLARLEGIVLRCGTDRHVYAAGGVRNPEDLEELAAMGVAGALVATALHDGRLRPHDIASVFGTTPG